MKILVAYICVTGGPITSDYAARFVGSYTMFPPGIEHETVIVCNGGPLTQAQCLIFLPVRCSFYPRSNDGWDIGGFLDVSRNFECDMLVCFGESVYFQRGGWLARVADVWNKYGPGMYGFFSSNLVRPHLNTTAFACDPRALSTYPCPVRSRAERYEFEHGNLSFWRRVQASAKPVRLVTWDGDWEPKNWRVPKNILWRGDQSNCLARCIHSDRYEQSDEKTREYWAKACNAPYRG